MPALNKARGKAEGIYVPQTITGQLSLGLDMYADAHAGTPPCHIIGGRGLPARFARARQTLIGLVKQYHVVGENGSAYSDSLRQVLMRAPPTPRTQYTNQRTFIVFISQRPGFER